MGGPKKMRGRVSGRHSRFERLTSNAPGFAEMVTWIDFIVVLLQQYCGQALASIAGGGMQADALVPSDCFKQLIQPEIHPARVRQLRWPVWLPKQIVFMGGKFCRVARPSPCDRHRSDVADRPRQQASR